LKCFWVESTVEQGSGVCEEVKESCEEITDGDMCRTNGAAVSSEGVVIPCVWVEDSPVSKCNPVKEMCSMIVEENRCNTQGAIIREVGCFWLYNETDGSDGNCREKDDAALSCAEVVNLHLCTDASFSETFFLHGKCKIFDDENCVFKCEYIVGEGDCRAREAECFWLLGGPFPEKNKCVVKV
jgi:hypothetical protein